MHSHSSSFSIIHKIISCARAPTSVLFSPRRCQKFNSFELVFLPRFHHHTTLNHVLHVNRFHIDQTAPYRNKKAKLSRVSRKLGHFCLRRRTLRSRVSTTLLTPLLTVLETTFTELGIKVPAESIIRHYENISFETSHYVTRTSWTLALWFVILDVLGQQNPTRIVVRQTPLCDVSVPVYNDLIQKNKLLQR